jgi:hypothetical protein
MFTIRPQRRDRIPGSAACVTRQHEVRFTASVSPRHSGIIHENVDGAEFIHHGLDIGAARYIGPERYGLSAAFRDFTRNLFRLGGALAKIHADAAAASRQSQRDLAPDAAACPCHQGRSSPQSLHEFRIPAASFPSRPHPMHYETNGKRAMARRS